MFLADGGKREWAGEGVWGWGIYKSNIFFFRVTVATVTNDWKSKLENNRVQLITCIQLKILMPHLRQHAVINAATAEIILVSFLWRTYFS